MAEEQSTGKSFFHTLPGIITAIAGLITAVGGFILILNKTGCLSSKTEKTEQNVVVDKAKDSNNNNSTSERRQETNTVVSDGNVSYSPSTIKHITRNLVYKIGEASAQTLPAGEIILNVKIKCTNNSDYEYHFYANYLGAKIGDDNYGPDIYSPSGNYQSVPPRSFINLEYNFKLPRFTNKFTLDVYDLDDLIGSSAFTLK